MGTNFKIIPLVVFIYFTTVFSTCKKSIICSPDNTYSFQINVKAYPDKDSIHVGDTIWFEINTPAFLRDISSGQTIDYSGAENLGSGLSFHMFTGGSFSDPGVVYAAGQFDWYLLTGGSINNASPEGFKSFSFTKSGGGYHFKAAIIPKQKGIFGVAIQDASHVYRESDKCTKAAFEITFADTDQHIYFYQENRPLYIISDYEATHAYCFKVY